MKIKIKQTFRSMWALVLAVLMLLSTFSAVAVTLNKEDTGANTSVESSGANVDTQSVGVGAVGGVIPAGEHLYYDFTATT